MAVANQGDILTDTEGNYNENNKKILGFIIMFDCGGDRWLI
jgi:hypothetical protein